MASNTAATPQPQNDDVADWIGRIKGAVAAPQVVTAPKQGASKWNSSFFGCLDPIDTCLITCCCPCVTFGKTHHRLRKDPNLVGYSPINVSCLGWFASSYCCLHWLPQILQRHDIKERYNLEGDFPVDCLKVWCCACCDLIQQDKEAAYYAANDAPAPAVTEQPDLKEAMQMPTPAAPVTA